MPTEENVVAKLARLARLKLSPAEAQAFSEQVPRILAYVDQLKTVEVTDVPPTETKPSALRSDAIEPSETADEIIAQAPTKIGRLWQVPPVK